jgi:hypothetical protein
MKGLRTAENRCNDLSFIMKNVNCEALLLCSSSCVGEVNK